MNALDRLKATHGRGIFVTTLPDGSLVPWRPLSIGDYFNYQKEYLDYQKRAITENEIFRKCVVDSSLTNNLEHLKAGTVTTTVITILTFSGPHGAPKEINLALEAARQEVRGNLFHSFVPLICQAFPGYKPDELYNLDYDTFMLRLAQAENHLLETKVLLEPIQLTDTQKEQSVRKRPPKRIDRLLNLRQEYAQQQAEKVAPRPSPLSSDQMPTKQTIISEDDIQEHAMAYTGHEVEDRIILEHEMLKNTVPVYSDYVEQMKQGKKVIIKSTEDRVAEAEERARKNKLRYQEYLKQKVKKDMALSELIAQASVTRSKKRGSR